METSIDWYMNKLGFEAEKSIKEYPDRNLRLAVIKAGDFHLELLEKKPSIDRSEFLPDNNSYLGGIFKLGFLINDIEKKYQELKNLKDVDFITEIGTLPNTTIELKWPKRYFLIKDPDGNYIQFFSFDDHLQQSMTPWLIMFTVSNIESVVAWYVDNLGFKYHQTVGVQGNRRAIIEKNNYVLELYEPSAVVSMDKIPEGNTVLGFSELAFGIQNFDATSQNMKSKKVQFRTLPQKSTYGWATKTMTVQDMEGNTIRLFKIKN